MRLIKMLGLAAIAALVAMAFAGATSASAANTQLCNTHTTLTCGSGALSVGMENVGAGTLLGAVDVICDEINGTGTPLALANPQSIHVVTLKFGSCETNIGDGCVVTVTELPLANLNKTGLDVGKITGVNGKVFVECENVFFGMDVFCEYDVSGLQFPVGAQHLTANKTQIDVIDSEAICPKDPLLDGLMVMKANRYILA